MHTTLQSMVDSPHPSTNPDKESIHLCVPGPFPHRSHPMLARARSGRHRPATTAVPTWTMLLHMMRQARSGSFRAWGMVLAACLPLMMTAQTELPRSEIYLFDLVHGPEGVDLRRPRALTAEWGPGYHNHPWFAGEKRLLVSSDARIAGKPDIWELDLERGTRRRVSSGPKSWFSPRRRPGTDRITAISLDPQGMQYLETFISTEGFDSEAVLPDEARAGYYAWKDTHQVALFLVGDPHELWLADLRNAERQRIALHPGRQLVFDDRGILHYVQKVAPGAWYLKTWDPASRLETMVTRTVEGSEDFCLLPDGTYLMASGSIIWRFHPQKDLRWNRWTDLAVYGIKHITRITHFEGRSIALVNQNP